MTDASSSPFPSMTVTSDSEPMIQQPAPTPSPSEGGAYEDGKLVHRTQEPVKE